jgi:FtsP/CotA-like multicopper oxidase with cupredoxin domain
MLTHPVLMFWSLLLPSLATDSLTLVAPNDNRRPAGRLRNGVLTLEIEATMGTWQAEGSGGPRLDVEVFAERGRAPQAPGPLIRVPAGSELRITLRNRLNRPVLIRGLYDRSADRPDSVDLAPGAVRAVSFRATTPGTYYYWGRTVGDGNGIGRTDDSQLLGAFIVDPPSGSIPDRILFLHAWVHPSDTGLPVGRRREILAINGKSWPTTERFAFTVGETVRWRVINGNTRIHPMHLHGFYFRVTASGTATRDRLYSTAQQRQVVTELMAAGTTMTMSWVPTRPGNWLFHCHLIGHIAPAIRNHYSELGGAPRGTEHHDTVTSHAYDGMAGLVIGIHVKPRGNVAKAAAEPGSRALRLFAQKRPRYLEEAAGYGFVLQEGASPPAPDSVRIPGSPIVLQRDEPVDITLVNRTDELVSVHWHGIEVDSYYDGVADWSGSPGRTAPRIAPGDSFVVRLKPDRAGTFIYHTHQDESAQLSSGLYGPLIVLAPNEVRDSVTDRVFLIGRGGPSPGAPVLLNGTTAPQPLNWTVGVTYRMRFINITANDVEEVVLSRDSTVQQWHPFAKDGAELPSEQAVARPSSLRMGPGETYDFEFTPGTTTDLTLAIVVRSRRGILGTIQLPIYVR